MSRSPRAGSILRGIAVTTVLLLAATSCRASTQTTLHFEPDRDRSSDEVAADVDRGGRSTDDESATETADSSTGSTSGRPESRESPLDTMDRVEMDPTPVPENSSDGGPPPTRALGGGEVDFTLTRDDIDCSEDELNGFPDTVFVVAHYVVDGNLGGPCFGSPDAELEQAWNVLAAITPPGQLQDLGLFGGYLSTESQETTLAFVNVLDDDGSIFQMSINLEQAALDPDELKLTMAHEFSHVFTSLSTQINRDVRPWDCETFHNTEGCFYDDSLMYDWIEEFWGDGLIDEIDVSNDPSNAAGEERCNVNPGFLGPYAASNPEEDFAEAFSAFVFRLPVDTPELQAKMNWFARQPGLVEFRDLAILAGYGPLDNFFQPCG